MRVGILPYPADPYLLRYWLTLFKNVFYNELDRLVVYHNSTIEPEMEAYIKGLCNDPKIQYVYEPKQLEHGDVINKALDYCNDDDLIVLLEDDGYIFKSGMVDYCFRLIEDGTNDIVGSKRGSCSNEILQKAAEKWGLSYEGLGDQGCNFFPCYFFTKVSILKQTTRHFGARAWYAGERIEPLGYDVDVPVVNGDTFVLASLELRNIVPQNRISIVKQYHANPYDLMFYETHQYLFDGLAHWTHIGSLSTGVGGVLRDNDNRALVRRKIEPPKGATIIEANGSTSVEEKLEWSRRVSFWLKFYETAVDNHGSEEFYQLYGEAVNRLIAQYGLAINTIRQFQKIYATLGL